MSKLYILMLFASLLGLSNAIAQEGMTDLVASAGDSYESATVNLEWSIGEFTNQTLNSENYILTEGFQQGSFLTQVSIASVQGFSNTRIYPNPASDLLQIYLKEQFTGSREYKIYDSRGILVKFGTLNSETTEVDLSELPKGLYNLFLKTQKQSFETLRVIKQ